VKRERFTERLIKVEVRYKSARGLGCRTSRARNQTFVSTRREIVTFPTAFCDCYRYHLLMLYTKFIFKSYTRISQEVPHPTITKPSIRSPSQPKRQLRHVRQHWQVRLSTSMLGNLQCQFDWLHRQQCRLALC